MVARPLVRCSRCSALIPASDVGDRAGEPHVIASASARALLPALELRDGVPPSLRTLVVVPTLLTTPAEVEQQIERLEVHYLGDPDGDLRFALLSDWTDAPRESTPDDDELLARATQGIAPLNHRHGPAPDGDRFLLLHRRRSGTRARASGSAGSASAASSTS